MQKRQPIEVMQNFRVDLDTDQMLRFLAKRQNTTRSKLLRRAVDILIDQQFAELRPKQGENSLVS